MIYQPKFVFPTNIYAVVFSVELQQTFGYYTGNCTVDGNERVSVNAAGFFEHTYFRW